MELKSGNLFVHWPTRQPISFKQICYKSVKKTGAHHSKLSLSLNLVICPWICNCTYGTDPQAKLDAGACTDGSLNVVLSNYSEAHHYLQDVPYFCQSRQHDSWDSLWPWLSCLVAHYHTSWDNRQIFLQL